EHPLDGRTDVWAVGVLLYELLSGSYPRGRPTDPAAMILAKIVTESARPLRDANTSVPETISAVVHKALEPALSERFPSMLAFREALLTAVHRRSSLMFGPRDGAGLRERPGGPRERRDADKISTSVDPQRADTALDDEETSSPDSVGLILDE